MSGSKHSVQIGRYTRLRMASLLGGNDPQINDEQSAKDVAGLQTIKILYYHPWQKLTLHILKPVGPRKKRSIIFMCYAILNHAMHVLALIILSCKFQHGTSPDERIREVSLLLRSVI